MGIGNDFSGVENIRDYVLVKAYMLGSDSFRNRLEIGESGLFDLVESYFRGGYEELSESDFVTEWVLGFDEAAEDSMYGDAGSGD